ncbi:hypothetical protein EDB84DRAFT_1616365 [Lactarius hengduanensis]|nr:hypothetical protein EDB84DRAFT_1616365 [Lactarius hengduanensis]
MATISPPESKLSISIEGHRRTQESNKHVSFHLCLYISTTCMHTSWLSCLQQQDLVLIVPSSPTPPSPIPPCRHSRRPRRRPLCCHFVTGRFVVVVVVVVVVVAVVVAPSLHGRQRSLRAADSHRYCAVVVLWSHHRCAVVAPSSRCCHTIFVPSVVVVVRLAPRHVRRRVGLALEWWWWLAVGVHVWEWRRWWASKKKSLAEAESAAWESIAFAHGLPPLLQGQHHGHAIHHTTMPCPLPPSPAAAGLRPIKDTFFLPKSLWPPLPPLCSTQACGPPPPTHRHAQVRRHHHPLQRTRAAANAPPHARNPTATTPHTARNLHRYNTNDDGDAREQHGGRNNGDADDDGDGM